MRTTRAGRVSAGPSPSRSWLRRITTVLTAAALTVTLAPAAMAAPTAAAAAAPAAASTAWGGNTANSTGGRDYFIDATGGSDAADGLSRDTAWKTLGKANGTTFQPGDRVLLKAGETWSDQQLWPKGDGADGKPIAIDAYGDESARRPYIATNGKVPSPFKADGTKDPETVGTTGAVVLRNQQYWEIHNLEVSNDDDFATDITDQRVVRDGIAVSINADKLAAGADSIMNHFRISNVFAHNIDGPSFWQKIHYGGINFQVFGSQQYSAYGTGGYYFQDVRIENNTFDMAELHAVQFAFNWFGDAQGQADETGKWHEGWEQLWVRTRDLYSRDVYIGHNYAKDTGQGAIQLADTKNMVVEYNEIDGFLKRYNQVSAGLYLWAGADSVMRYNEVYDGPANEYDATPWDLEFTNFNVTYEKNYSHDNLGGWMSYMGNSSNSVARYNLSVNDNGVILKNMLSTNYSPSYFTNNVFVYDGSKLHQFHDETVLSPIYWLNNVFYNTSTTPTTWFRKPNALDKAVFSNNAFYEAGGQASPQQPKDAKASTTDPQFVGNPADYVKGGGVDQIKDAAAVFGLKDTSPLIDAGRYNAHVGTTDFFDTPLYFGAGMDIGLQEKRVGAQVTNPVDTDPIEDDGVDTRVNLAKGKPAVASSTHPADNGTRLAAGKAVDGDDTTRWAAADAPTYPVTVDIDFGTPTTFDEVDLSEFTDSGTQPRINDFLLQQWNATTSQWETFSTQQGVGVDKVVKGFAPVTTTKLRLSITNLLAGQTYGPTISEIKVFNSAPTTGAPTVTPASGTYDRNPAKANDPANAVTFSVTPNGDTLQAIRYVTTSGALVGSLDEGDYVKTTVDGVDQYRLTPAFYADKQLGDSGLVFDFTSGKSVRVGVTITDSSTGGSDTTPPIVGAYYAGGTQGTNGWFTSTVELWALAFDNLDSQPKIEASIDGGAWTVVTEQFDVTGDGRHTVSVRATDAAGNQSEPVTNEVPIDGTAPTTTVTTDPGPNGSTAKPVSVTFAATDATSGVQSTQYRIDGGQWADAGSAPVVISTPGEHTVEYRSTDKAGNVEATQSTKVTISAVDVQLTAAAPPSAEGWYSGAVGVTMTAPANRTVQYRINAGAWKTYTRPVTLGANGQFTIDHRLLSGRTVVEGSQQSTVVRVDSSAPQVSWTADPSNRAGTPRNPVSVKTWSWDSLSGVRSTEYRVNGGQWSAAEAPVVFDRVGTFALEVRATDKAGNVSPARSTVVSIAEDPATVLKAPSRAMSAGWITVSLAGFHRYSEVGVSAGDAVIGKVTTDARGQARVTVRLPAADSGTDVVVTAAETGQNPVSATATVRIR